MLLLLFIVAFAASWWLRQHVRQQHPAVGQFVTVDGNRLHYLDSGAVDDEQQPTLVLIHGATGNLQDYKASIFPELSQHYRVIAFDRPGLGYSERPSGSWVGPHEQAELIRAALQQLGIKKTVLLGHSWSGALVLDYLLHHQDEVHAAVLLSPVSHAWSGGVSWYNYVQAVPVLREIFAYTVFPIVGWLGADSGVREVFEPAVVTQNYRQETALDLFFQPELLLNNFQDLRLLNEFVTRLSIRYPQISTPVQIISGTDDTVVYSWNHSQRLNRELQQVEWLDFPQTGHAPHHTHKEKVVETILNFLQKHQ